MRLLKDVITELRVKHYIKNLLVFIPAFLTFKIWGLYYFPRTILLFLSFCLASSFVYIVNDIVDCEHDKAHPTKCNRPVASGRISKKMAGATALLCLALSLLAVSFLNGECLVVILVYLLLNLMYSFYLKNVVLMDVACIALGFILRVVSGGLVMNYSTSGWLLLTIMALSFYLGFGKRRNEMFSIGDEICTRKVLKSYNTSFLDKSMHAMMTLSITFYSLWTVDGDIIIKYGTDKLIYTVPIVIIGLLRYSLIVEDDETSNEGDPTDIILSDKAIQLIALLYVTSTFIIISFA